MKRVILLLLSLTFLFGCAAQSEPSQTQPSAQATTEATTEPVTQATLWEATEAVAETTQTTEPAGFDPMAMVQEMSLEEKVGQMFLAVCPSLNGAGLVSQYHLGGYVLFGQDFEYESPYTLPLTLADYNSAAQIPLLFAVDEEGGTVCRVSAYSAFRASRFPSPRNAWAEGGMESALAVEEEKSQLLQSLGLNVNLAPVCDITTNSQSFMYSRSLGQDPQTTAEFIAATVDTYAQYGIGSTLKHFPGYGDNTDTHLGIALDQRSLEELEGRDLIPFQAGIDAGCGAIMVSHTFVNAMDETLPASLSPAVHQYMRNNMGFTGVIVTDDLGMGAIRVLYGPGEAGILAVLAGNDMLCTSDYQTQFPAIVEAVQQGRIDPAIIDAAVCRVLQWKYDLGLLTD